MPEPPSVQNVIAADGFAYGVIGANIHVFGNGLPLYLLSTWREEPEGRPDRRREPPDRLSDAGRAAVPVTGRAADLAELRAWRDSRPRLAVRWLDGPGGPGTTRVTAQLAADSAAAGWTVVAARRGPDAGTVEPGSQDLSLAGAAGLLMIVDNADQWLLSNLTWLLKNRLLHHGGMTTRVIMAGRTADAWPRVRGILDSYQAPTSRQLLSA